MENNKVFCPVRDIISHLGDKWSILVMLTLNKSTPMRFSELQREIPDVSQKMLTQTLRKLEKMSLVLRVVYPEVPPRVEYNLTELGKSFVAAISPMITWSVENREELFRSNLPL